MKMHIDHLVLKGFSPRDGRAIAAGVREELGRLLATPNGAQQLAVRGDLAHLKLGQVHIASNTTAAEIGARAARSVAGEITS